MSLTHKITLISFCLLFSIMEIYFFNYKIAYFFLYSPWVFILLLVAFHFQRGKFFLRDWLVFLSQLLFFNLLRGAIAYIVKHFQLPIYSQYIIDFEFLFTPTTSLANILQTKLTHPFVFSLLERLMAFIYISHFFVFFIIAFIIWFNKPLQFWRFHWAFMSCAFIALILYFLIPTVPPWMASEQNLIPVVRNILQEILSIKFGEIVKVFDTNPVAAMPSLHAAFPSLCFLSLRHHFGLKKSWPFGLYLIAIIFSTLLLGAHYIGDLLAGFMLAYFCFYICYHTMKDRQYSKENLTIDVCYQFGIALIFVFLQVLLKWCLTQMVH